MKTALRELPEAAVRAFVHQTKREVAELRSKTSKLQREQARYERELKRRKKEKLRAPPP